MSFPALRTAPVRLREAGFGPFVAGVQGVLIGVPLAVVTLGLVVALVAMPIRPIGGAEWHVASLLAVPLGVLWFGLLGIVIVGPALLAALIPAVLAARLGWAGWLVAVSAGGVAGALAGVWASGGVSSAFRWNGEVPSFGAIGCIYGAAFWLTVRWMYPNLLRPRPSRA